MAQSNLYAEPPHCRQLDLRRYYALTPLAACIPTYHFINFQNLTSVYNPDMTQQNRFTVLDYGFKWLISNIDLALNLMLTIHYLTRIPLPTTTFFWTHAYPPAILVSLQVTKIYLPTLAPAFWLLLYHPIPHHPISNTRTKIYKSSCALYCCSR